MVTSIAGILLFFARTTIVSGTETSHRFIQSNDSPNYKVRMDRDTLESLKNFQIHYSFDKGVGFVKREIRKYHYVPQDELFAKAALQAWTINLKEKESEGSCKIETRGSDIGVVPLAPEEVDEQFGNRAIWRSHDKKAPRLQYLLVVRDIGQNEYEWVLIFEGDLSYKKEQPNVFMFEVLSVKKVNDEFRFVDGEFCEKRLVEISDLFAKQHHESVSASRLIEAQLRAPREPEGSPRKAVPGDNAAIQRDGMDSSNSMAALAQECTQHQAEIKRLNDESVITRQQHQQEVDQIEANAEAELKKQSDRFDAEKARMEQLFAEEKREWEKQKMVELTQLGSKQESLESRWESLNAEKTESEQVIRDLRENENVLKNQIDELHTTLGTSHGELKELQKQHGEKMTEYAEKEKGLEAMKAQLQNKNALLQDQNAKTQRKLDAERVRHSEQMKETNAENSALVKKNNQFKDQMSRHEDLVGEMETAKAYTQELQEKLAMSSEKQTTLEATNRGLQNDIGSLQDEKREVDARLEESRIRENDLEARNAEIQRQLDSERSVHDAQLDEQHQAAVDAEQKLREKEEGIDHWIMISMFIGGGVLVVIGFIIFQLARRTFNEMYDHMEYELNEQLRRVKEPHPLVPEYPSAHANRLGVHEHPAVRDVFGMKEPWDVTPGEGFHVSRVTNGGDTPGTSRGEVDDETTGVPVMEGMNEGEVMEQDKEQMAESAEHFDI